MNEIKVTLQEHIEDIKRSMQKVGVGLVEIGFHLKEIRDNGLEQEKGYIDIWNLAEGEFGFSKSATSRMIGIFEQYGTVEFGTPKLRGEYAEFGKGQLIEMLNIPEEIREEIPTTATITQIRETKSILKSEERTETHSWDNDLTDTEKAIFSLFEKEKYAKRFPEVFKVVQTEGISTKEACYRLMMAITENGYETVKAAGYIIFLKEEEVTIMKGSYKDKINYDQLEDVLILKMNMMEHKSAKECWEAVYGKEFPEEQKQEEPAVEKPKQKVVKQEKKEEKKEPEKPIEGQVDMTEVAEPEYIDTKVEETPELYSREETSEEVESETVEAEIITEQCRCCEGEGIKEPVGTVRITYGRLVVFDDENPLVDIQVKYCPYCGKKVER